MITDRKNNNNIKINYKGFDDFFSDNSNEFNMLKVRMDTLLKNSLASVGHNTAFFDISVSKDLKTEYSGEDNTKNKKIRFFVAEPSWDMEQVILPQNTRHNIEKALLLLSHQKLIFETWNMKSIIPNAKTSLNFYGQPGTGKTMCAHAISKKLNKKIMPLNYAQIESKYVGDGPKNLDSAFLQAKDNDCVLFFDEADSLLGKRISNVSTGSDQAINSLRSQMLINLECFSGIVIFATNLIENYDQAFETRIKSIYFDLPDFEARLLIWKKHLPQELPLSDDVNIEILSEKYPSFSGRDIRNAVENAITDALMNKRKVIYMENFLNGCEQIILNRFSKKNKIQLSPEEQAVYSQKIKEKLNIATEKQLNYQ